MEASVSGETLTFTAQKSIIPLTKKTHFGGIYGIITSLRIENIATILFTTIVLLAFMTTSLIQYQNITLQKILISTVPHTVQ